LITILAMIRPTAFQSEIQPFRLISGWKHSPPSGPYLVGQGSPFGEPEGSAPGALEEIRPRNTARSLDHLEELIGEGRVDLRRTRDRGAWRTVDTDEEYDTTGEMRFSIQADDPLSAEQEINLQTTMGRPGWHIRTEAQTVLRCNADTYLVEASLAAWDGEEQVFHRRWEQRIPRDQQ